MILHLWVIAYIAGVYLRPGELIPALADVPVMDILAGGGVLLALISIAVKPRKFWNQPHDLFFIGFYVMLVASNPLNGYFGAFMIALTNFSTVAVTYFLIRMSHTTERQVRRTASALIVLTLFLAVNGLLQVYTGVGLGGVTAAETRAGARIMGTGIFSDANDLGMAMVTVVPLVLSVVLGKTSFMARLFNLVALIILVLACYYTNSRGTIIGLGVVFSIFAFRRYGWFTAGSLSAVGFAVILLFGPSRMSEVGSSDASSQGRIQAWASAMEMFQMSPFWGVGYGQFIEHHERAAHNSLMHALGELGIFGAVMFVGMFYWYFMGLRPALKEEASGEPPGEAANGKRAAPSWRRAAANGGARASVNGQTLAVAKADVATVDSATVRATNGVATAPANGKTNGAMGFYAKMRQKTFTAADRDFNRRLARDLSDCGIGMLACCMFLSRQYTVTMFIPLALAASFASAASTHDEEPEPSGAALLHLFKVPALTVCLVIVFWVGVKVLVRY